MKAHFLNKNGKLVLREATTTVGALVPGARSGNGPDYYDWKADCDHPRFSDEGYDKCPNCADIVHIADNREVPGSNPGLPTI